MKRRVGCGLLVLLLCAATQVVAREPRRDVLGLRLDMREEAAHRLLRRIGRERKEGDREEEEEGGGEEVWLLTREPRFAYVIIGFDSSKRVRYVTAIAREGGRRMRYSEVADLKDAKAESNMGNYRYTWEVKPRGKAPGYFLIATGRDPQYLTNFSIKRHD